jgi:DNA-binding transcriptional regulator YdaS (Cro superfamily)
LNGVKRYQAFLENNFGACLLFQAMLVYAAMSAKQALKEAKAKAGGPSALARLLKITPQAVDQWKHIPVAQVLKVEKALGIPRHFQRPDFYPPPAQEAAE